MTLKSIEKYFARYTTPEVYPWVSDMIADIEAEIAERFIELPVDADGVPIRVGDDLKFVNGELLCCEGVDAHGAIVWREEQFEFIQGDSLRHVEHDSLEHLLADVSKGAVRYPRERVTGYLEDNNSIGEAVMLDIRDRLRDLLGGDGL